MITYDKIVEANKDLPTIKQKGKDYVMVHERVKAFRSVEADGAIVTEIYHLDDDVVIMQATVYDAEGKILSKGTASESRRTEFWIEKCETSCIGRAMGALGIGIMDSFSSAEEVANAIGKYASDTEIKTLEDFAKIKGVNAEEIARSVGYKSGKVTREIHAKTLQKLMELPDA